MLSECSDSGCPSVLVGFAVLLLIMSLTLSAHGQSAVLDVKQFSPTTSITSAACGGSHTPLSADICGQIQAAICALPVDAISLTPQGVVDARRFSGSQTCGSNPFANPTDASGRTLFAGNITLLLGPVTIKTLVTWFLPQQTLVSGAGSIATELQASTAPGTRLHGASIK